MPPKSTEDLILEEIRDLSKKIDELKKAIYIGNGQKSIIDRLNRNTMVCSVLLWCVSVLYVAVVGASVTYFFKHFGA